MKRMIRFSNVGEVVDFVSKAKECKYAVMIETIHGNKRQINGKSIMALFALNLEDALLIDYSQKADRSFHEYINRIAERDIQGQ